MSTDALFAHNAPFYSSSLIAPGKVCDEIRLLKIDPGSFEDPISITMSTAKLDGELKFVALSYVWGDPTQRHSIVVDGRNDFWVTENAFAAIRRLRSTVNWKDNFRFTKSPVTAIRRYRAQTSTSTTLYWIDALCINQADAEERAAQVAMMGDIYSKAAKVVVWLGPCGENCRKGPETDLCDDQKFHDRLASWNETYSRNGKWTCKDTDKLHHLTLLSHHNGDFQPESHWWNRCWTFIEAVNASNQEFLIGSHWFSLESLEHGLLRIPDLNDADLDTELQWALWKVHLLRSGVITLRKLLEMTAHRFASEPRDKVYSILSLWPGYESVQTRHLIPIDYNKSIPQLVADTILAIVYEEKDLAVIFTMWETWDRNDSPWPSWAPDIAKVRKQSWQFVCTPKPWGAYSDLSFQEMIPGLVLPDADAKDVSAWLRSDTTTLVVKGLVLDNIELVGSHFKNPFEDDCDVTIRCHMRVQEDIYQQCNEWFENIGYWPTATVMAGFTRRHRGYGLTSSGGGLRRPGPVRSYQHSEIDSSEAWEKVLSHSREYQEYWSSGCLENDIFITEAGFLGTSRYVQPADIVVLIFGCSRPVVLRPTSNAAEYTVVWHTYMPCIKQGILPAMYKEGKIEARTFRLV